MATLLGGCRAVAETAENGASASAPEPVVRIDNESDPFATVVTVEYGDMLGELLDTVGGRWRGVPSGEATGGLGGGSTRVVGAAALAAVHRWVGCQATCSWLGCAGASSCWLLWQASGQELLQPLGSSGPRWSALPIGLATDGRSDHCCCPQVASLKALGLNIRRAKIKSDKKASPPLQARHAARQ